MGKEKKYFTQIADVKRILEKKKLKKRQMPYTKANLNSSNYPEDMKCVVSLQR